MGANSGKFAGFLNQATHEFNFLGDWHFDLALPPIRLASGDLLLGFHSVRVAQGTERAKDQNVGGRGKRGKVWKSVGGGRWGLLRKS